MFLYAYANKHMKWIMKVNSVVPSVPPFQIYHNKIVMDLNTLWSISEKIQKNNRTLITASALLLQQTTIISETFINKRIVCPISFFSEVGNFPNRKTNFQKLHPDNTLAKKDRNSDKTGVKTVKKISSLPIEMIKCFTMLRKKLKMKQTNPKAEIKKLL